MNRFEFIDRLQCALAGGLNSSQVTDNVRYYQEYIDSEIRKGRNEEDVLSSLGDPRLLAKSIIEANKHAGMNQGTNRTYDEEMPESGTYGSSTRGGAYGSGSGQEIYDEEEKRARGRVVRVPGWLLMLIITVVVVLVIGVALSLLSTFFPVIMSVLLVTLVVKAFQQKK